jgi:hypothetical protein
MKRIALAFAAFALLPAGAAAKEGVRATLTTRLDLKASPGTSVRVAGTLADRDGHPFGGSGLYVRLLGREGGSRSASATGTAGGFAAVVPVPKDGIGGIRIGLPGQACGPTGCHRADLLFPIVNDPFRTAGGVRCDVAAVAGALRSFADAFTRGDLPRLDALFARDTRFAWFSSGSPGARFSPEAGKRDTLVGYFADRHAQHDRIRLVSYRFNGYEKLRVIGHFELTFARRADDYRDGEEFRSVGKGAVDCSASPVRFMVLSLGGP